MSGTLRAARRRTLRRTAVSGLAALLATAGVLVPLAPGAQAVNSPQGRLVSDQPANGTPHVLDGGGQLHRRGRQHHDPRRHLHTARNDSSQTVLTRHRLLAFDETTGQISTSFVPDPNGDITTVIPAGDGTSVYVAGSFSSIGGVARSNIARVRVSDGAVITAFNAGTVSGSIKDLRLEDGRLWLAGAFTHVNGKAQKGLATVDPTTGAFDHLHAAHHRRACTTVATRPSPRSTSPPTGHAWSPSATSTPSTASRTTRCSCWTSPAPRPQPSNFRTSFYESGCSQSFDSYMRDLDFSPDGSFFVISTTGAYGGADSACDQTSRWETGATGTDVRPSWTDYTGGDTTYAVEITDSAVYTGGHARWQNNAFAGDTAGPGAVARPGIAALDPANGLPLSWNPTRTRGVGVFDFLVTSRGPLGRLRHRPDR